MSYYNDMKPHYDRPLYCFKIEDNGQIVKYTILYYNEVIRSAYADRKSICFKYQFGDKTPGKYEARLENLDKVANKKYYTFNPDESVACRNIVCHLLNKKTELLKQLDRLDELINHVEDKNRGKFK